MTAPTLPLIVLAGSDGQAGHLPEAGRSLTAIAGYKGRTLSVDGRPLVTVVGERFASSGAFGPIVVAGPARVYGSVVGDGHLVDTDGTFGENIAASLEFVRRRWPGRRVGFATCDVVPPVDGARRLAERLRADGARDLWFPLVRAPERRDRLGAASWKPTYALRPDGSSDPVPVLPGHLVVVDPEALRRDFLYRLFQIGYRTRNRSIAFRRAAMLRELLGVLIWQDLRNLAGLRPPTLTWTVTRAALPAVARLRAGTLTLGELERALYGLFVSRRHRRRHPERGVRVPLVDELWLALDVDTEEEARQLGADRPA